MSFLKVYKLQNRLAVMFLLACWCGILAPPQTIAEDLARAGWRLWPDTNAAWTSDKLYLVHPRSVSLK